jgi:uncharacterized integral membrane protein
VHGCANQAKLSVSSVLIWSYVCIRRVEDVLALGGAAGLGVSLWFIHIYVAPLKKFIQASGDIITTLTAASSWTAALA